MMFIKKNFWTLFLFIAVVLGILFVLPLTASAIESEAFPNGPYQTFTVTFDSQGGSAVAPETNSEEYGTIAFPAVPIKCVQDTRRYFDDWYISETYYYFDGWYTSTDYTEPWNFDGIVTQDMTLYAKWTERPRQTYAAYTYLDFTYSLINNNMEAVMDGYFGPGGDLVIPSTVPDPLHPDRQLPVVRLSWAWYAYPPSNNMDKVTSATVPDSVREVNYFFNAAPSYLNYILTDVHLGSGIKAIDVSGDWGAFYRINSLNNINLPQGLIYIGDMSFCGCTSLEHISIPNTVTHIGSNAFDSCGFENLVIPDSVATLGSETFARTRLTGITLGRSVQEIPYACFWDVPGLTGIVIPDSVSRIGMSAFGEDTNLSYMQIGNNVTTIGSGTFTDTAIKTVVFGRSITSFPVNIGDSIYFNSVHFIMMGNAPTQPGFLSVYSGHTFYCPKGATGYDAPGWENVGALYWYDPAALDWYTPASISFDLNGAEGNAPYNQDLYKGVYVNKPANPTRDGYSFGGWYTEASCQNAWNFNNPVAGDTTLYARWFETSPASISCTSDKTIVRVGETTDITLTVKDGNGTALPDKSIEIEGCGIYLQGVTDGSGMVTFRLTPSYEEAFRIRVDGVVYPDIVFGLENDTGILQVSANDDEGIPYDKIYLEIQNEKGRWERWIFSGNTVRMFAPAGDYEALVVCPGNDVMDGLYVVKTLTITAGQVTNNDIDWNGTVEANLTYTYDGKPIGNGEIQIAKSVSDGKESRWGRPVGYYSTLNNHTVHVTPGEYNLAAIGEDAAFGKLFLTRNGLGIYSNVDIGYNWNADETQIINFNISGSLSNDIVNRCAVIDKSNGVDINSGKLRINLGEHIINHIKGRTSSPENEEYLFEKNNELINITAEGEANYDLNTDPDGGAAINTDTPSVFPGNGVHLGVVLKTVSGHRLGDVNGNFDNRAYITVTDPDGKKIWEGYRNFKDFWYFVDWNAKPGEYTVHATGNLGRLYGDYDVTGKFKVSGSPEVKVTDMDGNPLILIPTRQDTDVKITVTTDGQPLSGVRVYMDGPAGHFEGDTDDKGEIVFTVNPGGNGNFNINYNWYNYDDLLFAAESDRGILEVSAYGNGGNPYGNIDLEIWGEKGVWGRGKDRNTVRILASAGEYEAIVACSGDDGIDGLYVAKTMTITAGQVTHEDVDWTGTVAANFTYTYDGKSINNGLIQFAQVRTEGKDDRWGREVGRYSTLDNRTVHVTPGTYNIVAMGDDQAHEWLFLTKNKLVIEEDGNYGYNWSSYETQILNVNFTGTMPDGAFRRFGIDKFGFGINSGLVRINLGTHEVYEAYIEGNSPEGFVSYRYQKRSDILDITADKAASYDFSTDKAGITIDTDVPSVFAGGSIRIGVMLTTVSGHPLTEANGNFDQNAFFTITDPNGNQVWAGYQHFNNFWYNTDWNAKPGVYTVHATGTLGWLYGNYDVTGTFAVKGKPEVKVTDLDGNPLMLIPTRQDTDVKITVTIEDQPLSGVRVYLDGPAGHFEGDTNENGKVVFTVNPGGSGNFYINTNGYSYNDLLFAAESDQGILEVSATDNAGTPYKNIDLEIWGDKGGWGGNGSGNTTRVLAPAGKYEAVVACPGNDGMDGLYVVKAMTVAAGQVTREVVDWTGTVAANLTYTYDGQSIRNGEIMFAKAGTDGKEDRWGRWLGGYSTLDNRTIHVTSGTCNLAITGENEAGEKLFLFQKGLAISDDCNYGYAWSAGETQILNLYISTASMDNVEKWISIDQFNMYIRSNTIRLNLGEYTIKSIDIKGDIPGGTVQYKYEKAGDIINITSDGPVDYYLDTAQAGDITFDTDTPLVYPGNGVHFGVLLTIASGHTLASVYGNFDSNTYVTVTDPDGNLVWEGYQYFRDFWYNTDWNAKPGEYTVRATGNFGWLYGSYDLTAKFTIIGKPEVMVTDLDGNPLMMVPTGRSTDVRITLTTEGKPMSGAFVNLDGPAGHFEGNTNENGEVVFTVNPGGSGNFFININGNAYDSLLFAVNDGDGILEVSTYDNKGTPYGNIDLEIWGEKGGWGYSTGGNTIRIIAPAGEYDAVVACGGNDGMDGLYVVKNMTVMAGQVTHEVVDWTGTVAANLTYTYDGMPIINGEIQFAKEGTDGKYTRWGRWLGSFSNLNNRVVHVTPGTYYLAAVGWDEANEKLFLTQNGLAINVDGNYGYAWSAGQTQILNLNISGVTMANANVGATIDRLYVDIGTNMIRINLGEHIVYYTEVKGDKPEGFVFYRYERPSDILNITSGGASDYYLDIAQAGDITLNVDTPSVSPGNGVHLGVSLTTISGHKLLEAFGNFDNSTYVTVTDPDGNLVWEGYQYFRDFWHNVDWNAKPGEYTVRATGNLGWLYGNYDVTAKFTVAGRTDVKITDMDGNSLVMIPTRQASDVRFTLTTDGQPISGVRVNLDGPAGHFEGDTNENGQVSFTVNPGGSGNFFININGFNYDDLLFAVESNQGLVEITGKDINGYPLENFEAVISQNSSTWGTWANGTVARAIAGEGQNLVKVAQRGGDGKEAYFIIKDIVVYAGEVNQVEITPEGTVEETLSFTYNGDPLSDGDVVLESREPIYKDLVGDLGFDNTVSGIKVYATPGTYKAFVNKIIQSDGSDALLYLEKNDLPFTEAGPREYSWEWDSSNTGKLHVDIAVPGEYNGAALVLNGSTIYWSNLNNIILSAGDYTINRVLVSKWNDSGWWQYNYSKVPGMEDKVTVDPAADASLNLDLTMKSVSVGKDNDKEKLQPGDIINFTLDLETNGGYMLNYTAGSVNNGMIAEVINPDGTSEVNYLNFNWMRLEIPEGKPNGIYTLNLKADLSPFYPIVEATTTFEVGSVAVTAATDETFSEGSEDGKVITVSLNGGVFNTDVDAGKVSLTGLPEGVSMGAVTRTGDTTITIALSGNSAVDYDDDITVGIIVGKDQVAPGQFVDLTGSVILKATVEPQPAAPEITFSFDGKHAGKLVGIKADTMEYSLNGDEGYITATQDNLKLSDNEIASITDAADIRVRLKEDFRIPAGTPTIIDILTGPGAPTVTGDDTADKVDGLSKDMEFSKDGGITWTNYQNKHSLGDLSGTFTLLVRIPATGTTMAGAAAMLNFTAEPIVEPQPTAPERISFSFDGRNAGKLTRTTTAMEFSLDGGNIYIPVTENDQKLSPEEIATISAESDILVRVKETPGAPAGEAAIIDILSREAPAISSLEEITKDMEYSIDGGITWMKYDKKELKKLDGITQIMVRYFATENKMASDPVTLDIPVA